MGLVSLSVMPQPGASLVLRRCGGRIIATFEGTAHVRASASNSRMSRSTVSVASVSVIPASVSRPKAPMIAVIGSDEAS